MTAPLSTGTVTLFLDLLGKITAQDGDGSQRITTAYRELEAIRDAPVVDQALPARVTVPADDAPAPVLHV